MGSLIGNGRVMMTAMAACAAVAAFAGCGDSDDGGGTATSGSAKSSGSDERVKVALLDAAETTYGVSLIDAAEKAAAKHNVDLSSSSANFDPQLQLSQCQDVIAKGQAKAIVLYPIDNAAAVPCVKEADRAGIPVVTLIGQVGPKFQADEIQVKEVDAQIWFDVNAEVDAWASQVKEWCKDKDPCKLALMGGPQSYAVPAAEKKGLEAAIKDAPNVKLVSVQAPGYDAPDKGIAATQDLLGKHPDIDVIIGDDATLVGVVKELKAQDKLGRVGVIGQGGNKAGVQRILDGEQFASAISTPRTDAAKAIELAAQLARGQKPAQTNIASPTISPLGSGNVTLTKENASSYQAEY